MLCCACIGCEGSVIDTPQIAPFLCRVADCRFFIPIADCTCIQVFVSHCRSEIPLSTCTHLEWTFLWWTSTRARISSNEINCENCIHSCSGLNLIGSIFWLNAFEVVRTSKSNLANLQSHKRRCLLLPAPHCCVDQVYWKALSLATATRATPVLHRLTGSHVETHDQIMDDLLPLHHRSNDPAVVPRMSQIPGLNPIPPEETEGPMSNVKPTDTDYIVLCKQGGRKDLLNFSPVFKPREPPKSYPTVDWFYLEDNAMADRLEKEKNGPSERAPLAGFGDRGGSGAAECLVHHDWRQELTSAGKSKPRRPPPFRTDPEPPRSRSKVSRSGQKSAGSKSRTTLPERPRGRPAAPQDDTTMRQILSFAYARKE